GASFDTAKRSEAILWKRRLDAFSKICSYKPHPLSVRSTAHHSSFIIQSPGGMPAEKSLDNALNQI
ncbi:MAG: hypothetical protein PHQ78_00900, partial [Candidatus Cloacimonetes bacterium]|nr:hypothetical protein [Candidatus Cloacimonadota bacterium]